MLPTATAYRSSSLNQPSAGQAWTQKHDLWLRRHRPGDSVLQIAFAANYEAVLQATARRDRLDQAIGAMAADSQFTALVDRLGCLRGISTLTGFALAVENTDWHRFTGNTIGAFLGLVPAEHSSGQTRSLGGITKTGTSHARRLLIEAGTTYQPDHLRALPRQHTAPRLPTPKLSHIPRPT